MSSSHSPGASTVDLPPAAVIHVEGYSSRGHPPKNKYLFIVGRESRTKLAAFLISSQQHWRASERHSREMVRIPQNATNFLRLESFIQCWALELLDVEDLRRRFGAGSVRIAGKLPIKYLYKVRDVVRQSYLLEQQDVETVLRIVAEVSS